NTGEVPNLTGERAFVEPLCVPRRENFERAIDMDLHEVCDLPFHFLTRLAIRGDCGDYGNDAITCEQLRDKPDTPDVRITILACEAKALRQICANDIAIQQFHFGALFAQTGNQPFGERALSRAR